MHHFQFVRYRFVFETSLQADIQLMPCRERTDQALLEAETAKVVKWVFEQSVSQAQDTDAKGGAGVFAYKNGTASISDTIIHTKQDTSGGTHAAGGGTVKASNLTVTTEGESSAAIRSDRGGGTITVNGGSYASNGSGSPAVYCTADITVKCNANQQYVADSKECIKA